MISYKLKSVDDYSLNLHIFEVEKPKAIVQFIHGMEEHQERYENFISFLNQNGYTVVSSDLRGHGENAEILGHFSDKNGYKLLVEDQKQILEFLKSRYNDIDIYLFSHSMGSIIARNLLQSKSNEYNKVILSGYPNYKFGAYFGIFFSNIIKLFNGPKYKSLFLEATTVGVFNKKIKHPKTLVDWLCKNEDTVNAYLNDNLCAFGFTCSAFNDLYHLVINMHKKKRYKNINHNLPVYFLCGKEDASTGGKRGRISSRKTLEKVGFLVQSKEYDNMRHEILNEKENMIVYKDILEFYNK